MYVSPDASKTYCAAVILYDCLFKTAAEGLSNFNALPSSVREFIFIPNTFGSVEYIKQMARDINTAEVQPDEVLSDNIYRYDSETYELAVIP